MQMVAFIVRTHAGTRHPVNLPGSINLASFIPLLDMALRRLGVEASYEWPELTA